MREMRIIAWLNHARYKMKEIADGGDGKQIAVDWLRDFEVDVAVAKKEDETPPRSEFYEGMVYINETILKKNPETPLLEKSGVRYDPDPANEHWHTVLDIITRGRGDVEDLATWRAAELRRRGENATVALRGVPGRWLTCVVIRADGTEEDVTKLVERHYEPGKCLECGRSTLNVEKPYCIKHRWMEVSPGAMPELDDAIAEVAAERESSRRLKKISLDGHRFLGGQGDVIILRAHEDDTAHVRYEVRHTEKPQLKGAGVCSVDALPSTLRRLLAPEETNKVP